MSLAKLGSQSPLAPHAEQAAQIAELGTILIIGAAVIYLAVLILAIWALRPRRPQWLHGNALIVGGGLIFPLAVMCALFAYSVAIGHSVGKTDATPVRLLIVGEMWWWRVHYLDDNGQVDFATANEIHLPIGRTVEIALTSADVIHSFWLPGASGMLDMIPGRVNRLRLTARVAGALRGQCTEFCGMHHARMAFRAQVSDGPTFDAWRQAQRASASQPATPLLSTGKALFEQHCATCHTVRGTAAAGPVGPDLTHVGSRMSIVAGMLPNNVGTIAGWIASSQHLKPGNRMPSFDRFTAAELQAVASYVESLQ